MNIISGMETDEVELNPNSICTANFTSLVDKGGESESVDVEAVNGIF